MRDYHAPLGPLVTVITIGVSAALLVAALALLRLAADRPWMVLPAAACVAILVWAALFAPLRYRVDEHAFVIERPSGKLVLPLRTLRDVAPFVRPPGLTLGLWRNGGLFGIYGIFWNRRLGWFHAYGRRVRPAVALTFADRRVIVMPDDTDGFIADLRARIAR